MPIHTGICVEGVQLGRLSYSSIGMLRGEITCSIPEQYDWTRFGASSAIATLNEIITRIQEIPIPRRPKSHIFLDSVHGGHEEMPRAHRDVRYAEVEEGLRRTRGIPGIQ